VRVSVELHIEDMSETCLGQIRWRQRQLVDLMLIIKMSELMSDDDDETLLCQVDDDFQQLCTFVL